MPSVAIVQRMRLVAIRDSWWSVRGDRLLRREGREVAVLLAQLANLALLEMDLSSLPTLILRVHVHESPASVILVARHRAIRGRIGHPDVAEVLAPMVCPAVVHGVGLVVVEGRPLSPWHACAYRVWLCRGAYGTDASPRAASIWLSRVAPLALS